MYSIDDLPYSLWFSYGFLCFSPCFAHPGRDLKEGEELFDGAGAMDVLDLLTRPPKRVSFFFLIGIYSDMMGIEWELPASKQIYLWNIL